MRANRSAAPAPEAGQQDAQAKREEQKVQRRQRLDDQPDRDDGEQRELTEKDGPPGPQAVPQDRTHVGRLAESPPLQAALAEHPRASLAVLLSGPVFEAIGPKLALGREVGRRRACLTW